MSIRTRWRVSLRWVAINSWCQPTFSGGVTGRGSRLRSPSPPMSRCSTTSSCRRRTMCFCLVTRSWCRFSRVGSRSMIAIRKRSCPIFSGPSPGTTRKPCRGFITSLGTPALWNCLWWRINRTGSKAAGVCDGWTATNELGADGSVLVLRSVAHGDVHEDCPATGIEGHEKRFGVARCAQPLRREMHLGGQYFEAETLVVEGCDRIADDLIGEFKDGFLGHIVARTDFRAGERARQIGGGGRGQVDDDASLDIAGKSNLCRDAAALIRILGHEDFAHTRAAAQALSEHRVGCIDEGLDQLHFHAWAPSAMLSGAIAATATSSPITYLTTS